MDDATLAALLGRESERVELTAAAKDAAKVGKAICAFANDIAGSGEPGYVVVGANDDGSCANITVDDELLKRLSEFRNDGKILPQPIISVTAKVLNGCQVAAVEVAPAYSPPVRYNGRCWIRVGPTTREATADEERKLSEKRREGDLTFDQREVRPHVAITSLDMRYFDVEYLPKAVAPEVLAQNNRTTEDQMRGLRFLSDGGKPNYACLLCFGSDPRHWLPCPYIQFVRFGGEEMVGSPVQNQKAINGNIFHQIEMAESLLSINISEPMDLSGSRHVVTSDYPLEALKQYIRNAVMHRDYEAATPIRVYWFSDRIEITNPGELYGSASITKGLTGYRNPVIAEALKAADFVERFGYGIPLAERAMKRNGNPPPEYEIGHGHFRVTLRPAQQTAAREH